MMAQLNNAIACWALISLAIVLEHQQVDSAITITKIFAGKKKFKTYSLGLSFLPTLVKIKPNRFHFTVRQNQYIRPAKFKMDGSLPLKIPTIVMPKRNPYTPVQDIELNADLSIGADNYKASKKYHSAESNIQPIITNNLPVMSNTQLQVSESQQVNQLGTTVQTTSYVQSDASTQSLSVPVSMPVLVNNNVKRSSNIHLLSKPIMPFKRSAIDDRQLSLDLTELATDEIPAQHQPMKINIGEHYDPNMIYVDEQLSSDEPIMAMNNQQISRAPLPQIDYDDDDDDDNEDMDTSNMDSSMAESVRNYAKYYDKKKYKNDGPDDIRVEFSLTGPHGGPKVPYGFADDQDRFNKKLNKFQQSIPMGVHGRKMYNYYLRNTYRLPLKVVPNFYTKTKKVKSIPNRKKKQVLIL